MLESEIKPGTSAREISQKMEEMFQFRASLRKLSKDEKIIVDTIHERLNKSAFLALRSCGYSPEEVDRILLGIFHHPAIQKPPELEYKYRLS